MGRDIKHGKCKTTEYYSFIAMKQRCRDSNHKSYKDYGGRGIKICDRWSGSDGFMNFLDDLGVKPDRTYTLDRIHNDGNYEPSNCRWAKWEEQVKSRRKRSKKVSIY